MEFETDKGTSHSYIEIYDKLFQPLRDLKLVMLEIGIASGGSMPLWKQYFPYGEIYGVEDYSEKYSLDKEILNDRSYNVIIEDITNYKMMDRHISDVVFDIVVDDGSHQLKDQLSAIRYFKNKMNADGLYIIEDCCCWYDFNSDWREQFYAAKPEGWKMTIIDRRFVKNRFDDVMVVFET